MQVRPTGPAEAWRTLPVNIFTGEAQAVWHALQGQFSQAAQAYLEATDWSNPDKAVQLFNLSGQPADLAAAARVLKAQAHWLEARSLYEQAGDWPQVARMYEALKDPLNAASIWEKAGNLAEAAARYEQGGNRVEAKRLYRQINHRDKLLELGDADEQMLILLENNDFLGAAELAKKQARFVLAANYYQQAGAANHELEMRRLAALQGEARWEQVAELARQQGRFATEAEAWVALKQPRHAAEACERAARQADPHDLATAAGFYQQAETFYKTAYEHERAKACFRHRLRCEKRPWLAVENHSRQPFYENEQGLLELVVKNTGYGLAHQVTLRVEPSGEFQVRSGQQLPPCGIPETGSVHREIYLKPILGQLGITPVDVVLSHHHEANTHTNPVETRHTLHLMVTSRAQRIARFKTSTMFKACTAK